MINDEALKGQTAVEYRRVKNFLGDLASSILTDGQPFAAEYALSRDPIPLKQTFPLDRTEVKEGEVWGRTWESGYFRLRATVPEAWAGKALAAWLDFGGEGLIYSAQGVPLYGITNGSSFTERYAKDVYRLSPACQGGEALELWVEAAANNLFGVKEAPQPVDRRDPFRHGTYEARIRRMRLCVYHEDRWQLFLDMRTLFLLYESLDPELKGIGIHAPRILRSLLAVTHAYQGNPENTQTCRNLLVPELSKRANASSLATTVVGHAHIDTAWLWTLSETRRKVARTFASQLDLIDHYPGYVFGASAALHHLWVKQDHPELYERISRAVAAGSWEPQGGMWIEVDCNLPSGESLVRQILHGKNFWKDEFGVEVNNCWIPDVFGYAGSLPQILRKSGIEVFLTHKLSWSKFSGFPHDTFRWRGIDDSEVTVHFPPERTYNSNATPDVLRRAEQNYLERSYLDEFITLMGLGDGGGGPKEEHLEYALRSADLEDVPRARLGRSDQMLARVHARRDELPVWVGELYLEFHRGTYTTQAATKKNNRRLEQELRAVEALWAALPGLPYPQEALTEVVHTLMVNQFHDIIPGSSIHAVYEQADRDYARAFQVLTSLGTQAASHLFTPEAGAVTLFHGLSTAVPTTVTLPPDFGPCQALDEAGRPLPTQVEGNRTLVTLTPRAHGFTTLRRGPALPPTSDLTPPLVLENALVRYRFAPDGTLVEAWNKTSQRPLLRAGGQGNLFSLYEDTPHNYEAWDIDFYYRDQFLEHARPVSCEAGPRGPVRQSLVFHLAIGQSTIRQTVSLDEGSALLTFETSVDWKETRKLLRVAFAVDARAPEATCEIAYGQVKRPTHANTQRDFAQFEVCAHRWVDVGDEVRGVALLNDSKYGYSVRDNLLDLALLRAPLYPDPEADQGLHAFTYALLPREGALATSEVQARAEVLNRPPLAWSEVSSPRERAGFWVEGGGLSLEAVKKAEKGEDRILRLVETRGRESRGWLCTDTPATTLAPTDLMEWNDGPAFDFPPALEVVLAPFEIRTYRVAGLREARAIMPLTPAWPIHRD